MSDLTPDDVKEILRLIDEAGYEEFEIETPRFSLRFNRSGSAAAPAPSDNVSQRDHVGPADGLVEVVAPMVGTFYRAPSPGAAPFVEVGAEVDDATQVCIIEVMKLMNSVAAGTRGVVAEVCREDGSPVQYGDVLFRIRPA